MKGVEFDEQNNFKGVGNSNPKGMIGWLIKKKIVKDVKNANTLLITISIICLVLVGFLLLKQNSSGPQSEPLSEYEIRQLPDNDFRKIHFSRVE